MNPGATSQNNDHLSSSSKNEGRLIDHGAAPYNHNSKNKENYYVKLETNAGEKTVWGIDLNRPSCHDPN